LTLRESSPNMTSVSAVLLCLYPLLCKDIQDANERVYAVLGRHWNASYPDCLKIIQDVNEHVHTVPGTYWNTRYPDCVRNIHVVNGRSYTLPGTHWNALRHCFQLVPGIFTLAWPIFCRNGRYQKLHAWLHSVACLQSIQRLSPASPDVFSALCVCRHRARHRASHVPTYRQLLRAGPVYSLGRL